MDARPRQISKTCESSLAKAIGFRFAVTVIALTAMAVGRVELERQALLLERNALKTAERKSVAMDRLSRCEVDLSRLSAPGALLTAGSKRSVLPTRSAETE